jgi:AraC-like DNA-binding protein
MSNLAYRETADKMSGAAVNLILNTANSIGIDWQRILREAGLPPPTREGREIRLAGAPSPDQQGLVFRRLVDLLCERTPQRGARDSPAPDDVNLFCSCLVNCENLEGVIERAIRFTRISNNRWGELRCEREGGHVVFSMDSRRIRNAAGPVTLDLLSVAFFYKLFSWLIAEPLRMQWVNLGHDVYTEGMSGLVFSCPIRPGNARTSLVFDADLLRKPVLRTYKELVEVLGRWPVALLPVPRSVLVRDQVELIFNRAMDACIAAPRLEQVATKLGQSVSTLRRNLLRENTSFQAILDCLRMQRASALLRETGLTIEELASVLGFSSAGVFSRAFKSWTGQSPSGYRLAADCK